VGDSAVMKIPDHITSPKCSGSYIFIL